MQQFVVPQFIDVEDKVIGPITVRQFIILIFGGGLIFVEYKLADFALFVFEGLFTLAVILLLAFYKINGQAVHYFILNFIQTLKKPALRVWDKTMSVADLKAHLKKPKIEVVPTVSTKRIIGTSKLAELSLIVDTGGVYRGDQEPIELKK